VVVQHHGPWHAPGSNPYVVISAHGPSTAASMLREH
jgi:transcriptional regulatory protein LevR